MIRILPVIAAIVAVTLIGVMSAVFIVDERKQALVLQFGQVKQVVTKPGWGIKWPFIQDVVYYEGRILPLETGDLEVTPRDERRLLVDAFARWRITDVVLFRQAVQTEVAALSRLKSILTASLREVLGSVTSKDIVSPERTLLMIRIRDSARAQATGLGVEIIDVRIRRADLPEQNLNATFARMNAEREREAADERARGKERRLWPRSGVLRLLPLAAGLRAVTPGQQHDPGDLARQRVLRLPEVGQSAGAGVRRGGARE